MKCIRFPRGGKREEDYRFTVPSKSNGPLPVLLSRAAHLRAHPSKTPRADLLSRSRQLGGIAALDTSPAAAEHTRISVHEDANGGRAAQVDGRTRDTPQEAPNDRADHCCVPLSREKLTRLSRRYFCGVSDECPASAAVRTTAEQSCATTGPHG
jgi:hypothetical protein